MALIAGYAAEHRLTIVRTFIDEGISGLRINNRQGLIGLLNEIGQSLGLFSFQSHALRSSLYSYLEKGRQGSRIPSPVARGLGDGQGSAGAQSADHRSAEPRYNGSRFCARRRKLRLETTVVTLLSRATFTTCLKGQGGFI
ncbi:hypothetical protein QA649_23855 [Bradyrhizobium sp. CB1717]|uniref:hypothetical protein n=1 Tax=Bradyrhizobium sp. CB1717 TaxID=3039154 RepID=UPI0024B13D36|nr:hypothetical protein [Bradyrhizobium sp. CB1717]WFU28922.1 hypothetical protein QA649_23855 [Bradyrhizobium sp. CB1717]